MRGRERIIKMFDSILRFDTFSKYNMALDKKFKYYSLKNLVNSLKNRPEIEVKDKVKEQLMRIIEKQKIGNETMINSNKKSFLPRGIQENNTNIFDKNFSPKQKQIPIKKKTNYFSHEHVLREKILDPYKYNPNYTSIYKNIPSVKFRKPKKKSLNIYNKKIHNRENKVFLTDIFAKTQNNYKEKIINNLKLNTSSNLNFKKNTHFNSMSDSINDSKLHQQNDENSSGSEKKSKKKKNFFRFNRNNHALRFSKYLSRKDKKIDVNDKVSYIDPYNYLIEKNNKALDFSKMKERSWKDMINLNTVYNPSMSHYRPKYGSLETKPLNVIFNPSLELQKEDGSKKCIVQKILSSYYVSEDYKLVDNNKLKPAKTQNSLGHVLI